MSLDDPIHEIQSAIEDARVPSAVEAVPSLSLDPLSALRFRIAQSHPAASFEPLTSLFESLAAEQTLDFSTPYVRPADPMESLEALLRGEAPANDNGVAQPVAHAPKVVADAGLDTSLLGEEVAAILTSRPLTAEARAEAVRRTLVAVKHPTEDNVRAILAALLSE